MSNEATPPTVNNDFVGLSLKIRGPLQLAGFLFSVFSASLIYRVDPDNIKALAIVGGIGVALITIPLAFRKSILQLIPKTQRVFFLLILIVLLLASFSVTAIYTASFYVSLKPQGARFDSTLNPSNINIVNESETKSTVHLTWDVFTIISDNTEGATIFTGIAVIHDESKIVDGGIAKITDLACDVVPSCLGWHYFEELQNRPVLVRGGAVNTTLTASIPIVFNKHIKKLRVYWEFYQREGLDGHKCGFDNTKPTPRGGLPYLAMYNQQGDKISNLCYLSVDRATFDISNI